MSDKLMNVEEFTTKVLGINWNELYPFWRNYLHNVFERRTTTSVQIQSPIGSGKTTIAQIIICYQIYLMHEDEAHKTLLRSVGDTGGVINVMVSERRLFEAVSRMILGSSMIKYVRHHNASRINFRNNIEMLAGDSTTDILGRNLFSVVREIGHYPDVELARMIDRRIQSRFGPSLLPLPLEIFNKDM